MPRRNVSNTWNRTRWLHTFLCNMITCSYHPNNPEWLHNSGHKVNKIRNKMLQVSTTSVHSMYKYTKNQWTAWTQLSGDTQRPQVSVMYPALFDNHSHFLRVLSPVVLVELSSHIISWTVRIGLIKQRLERGNYEHHIYARFSEKAAHVHRFLHYCS